MDLAGSFKRSPIFQKDSYTTKTIVNFGKIAVMEMRKALMLIGIAACFLTGALVMTGASPMAQVQNGDFVPPDRDARRAATGSTRQLSRTMRKALVESELFQPIPTPRPGDWLDAHHEPGQTFAQFARSRPNRPDQARNTLYFVPLGDYDETVGPELKSLERFARAFFGMPVKTLPVRSLDGLPIKVRQRSDGPKQLLSTDVLAWLKPILPDDAYCLLAITMEDLYPDEKWNYVFGQASLNDRVGVYSFIRYTPEFHGEVSDTSHRKTILRRSCKVLAHETGHMFGIRHCVHFHCLMNGSNNLSEADRQPLHLCPVCLRKLHFGAQFDVPRRYESLRQFSEEAKWQDEADWMAARLQQLQ